MKSLELIEEFNKTLIEANKKCNIAYEKVGEQDKLKSDLDHDLINNYKNMTAKEKREYIDKYYECLVERHNYKYEHRELEILKELFNRNGLERAINETIFKLRKLKQEKETPIYYKRAKRNRGEIIIVNEEVH